MRARRKGRNEGERRMSHHMPWVDTLAPNPLVILTEYGCTGVGTLAPRPKAVRLALTSATKRYGT